MAVLTPVAKMQFLDATGAPLVGGLLYTYAAGTTTPQATYTDSTGATANTIPVVLDARGEANIWLASATYKFKLCNSDGSELWTVDNISAPTSSLSPVLSGNVTIDSDSAGPALKITQTGTGPVLRVQDSVDPDSTPFIIDSIGQVGIGTQSPSTALDVNDGVIQLSSGGVSRTTIAADASNTTIASPGVRGLILSTGGTPRLTFSSAGAATFSGAVTVNGATIFSGGVAVTGNSTVTGTLGVSNTLTVSSGGAVITGNSSVTGTFGVSSTLTASNSLIVSAGGATITAGGLTVSAGGATITGNSSITGTFGVSSTLTASNGLTVSAGGATITGNSSVTGTLSASSTLTASNGLTVSAGGASITGNSSVTGTFGVTSTLNVTGATTMASNLTIQNSTTEMAVTLGSSGGYYYGNATQIGWKASGGVAKIYWDTSGNFTAAANVTAYSDAKLKKNVTTITNALELVNKMRGVYYDRIDTGEAGVGVIAQEMQAILPQVVKENDDALSVAYGNIIGVLIEAIKELSAKLEKQ